MQGSAISPSPTSDAPHAPGELGLEDAVAHLGAAGLLAYPTETVWGLGADAGSRDAVAALRAWKGREADRPLSILVAGAASAMAYGIALPDAARRFLEGLWPGPVTLVVPAAPGRWAPGVARADGAIGLRCPSHPGALALVRACQRAGIGPPTATSLNRSGEPAVADRRDARALCAGPSDPRILAEPVPSRATRVSPPAPMPASTVRAMDPTESADSRGAAGPRGAPEAIGTTGPDPRGSTVVELRPVGSPDARPPGARAGEIEVLREGAVPRSRIAHAAAAAGLRVAEPLGEE